MLLLSLRLMFIILALFALFVSTGSLTGSYLEPVRKQGIDKSKLFDNLIIVGTLDGTIFAVDRYSGIIKWQNNRTGGPLVNAKHSCLKENTATPFYMVEAYGDGFLHVFIPGESIKVWLFFFLKMAF